MKRVPYTFPFHNLPPEPVFFQKGLFLYFLPFLTLDKIKVGGDSCSPQHSCKTKIKVSSPSYKIREPSRRTESPLDEELNDEAMREELDMVEEIRTGSSLREAKLKQQIALRYNAKVIKREFEVGALVLRRNMKDSREGKLAPNWEGPYRVYDKTENGAYYLEDLLGVKLARPWNAEKLRRYHS